MFAGFYPDTWISRGKPDIGEYAGVQRLCPQRGQGAEPLVRRGLVANPHRK